MEVAVAKCEVCGGPTKVARSSGRAFKYCSNECRARWRARIASPVTTRPCEHCGAEFSSNLDHAKYCSHICREEASRQRSLIARRATVPIVACAECGAVIDAPKPSQKFCTRICRDIHRAKAAAAAKGDGFICCCATCKTVFRANSRRKYCTPSCSPSHWKNQPKIELERKMCEVCGKEFTGRPNKKYCDSRCAKKALRARHRMNHKERCQKHHRKYEPIDPYKVFERDNWMCGICFAPIDRDTVAPDPLAASLDHIVPLSRGGDHVLDNVQCAHFGCNSIKQASLAGEIKWPDAG